MKAEDRHHKMVKTLCDNPNMFLNDIVLAAEEARVFSIASGNIIKVPDCLFIDKYGRLSFVEYKSSKEHYEDACVQLYSSLNAMFKQTGMVANLYFAYYEKNGITIQEVVKMI